MIVDTYKSKLEAREEVDDELHALVARLRALGVGKGGPPKQASKFGGEC